MSSRGRIDSIDWLSERALIQIKAWLEPWLLNRVRVAAPVDLADFWRFNYDNDRTPDGWGLLETEGFFDHSGYAGELGFLLKDRSRKGMMLLALDADTISPSPQPTWLKVVEGEVTAYTLTSDSGGVGTTWDENGIESTIAGGTARYLVQNDGNGGLTIQDADGGIQVRESGGGIQILELSNGGIIIDDNAGGLTILSGLYITITSDGLLQLKIGSGANFEVLDSNGDPMLRMTDGSPDLHIPTGGTVVADL